MENNNKREWKVVKRNLVPESTPVKVIKTVDLTPTWAGIMPILIAALEHGTSEGKTAAKEELKRLAKFADQTNAERK